MNEKYAMKKAIAILISISLLAAYGHYHDRGRKPELRSNYAHSCLKTAMKHIDPLSADPDGDRQCPACSLLNSYKILSTNQSLILFIPVSLQIRIFSAVEFTDNYQRSSGPTRAPPVLS